MQGKSDDLFPPASAVDLTRTHADMELSPDQSAGLSACVACQAKQCNVVSISLNILYIETAQF